MLNFLRVLLESILEHLRLSLQMIDGLGHEIVDFVKLAREFPNQLLLLLTHLMRREVPDRFYILLDLSC